MPFILVNGRQHEVTPRQLDYKSIVEMVGGNQIHTYTIVASNDAEGKDRIVCRDDVLKIKDGTVINCCITGQA